MKFSIITPTYNRASLISVLINDVLKQSYTDWEFLLVDDGSTDNTKDLVAKFQDNRIKYIYQTNAERSAARNNGLQHSTGDFIVFIDSDDTIPPNFLEELAKTIRENNQQVGIYSTRRRFLDNETNEYKYTRQLTSLDTAESILRSGDVILVDQCAHKSCFDKHTFKSGIEPWEDTHLYLRLIRLYPVFETKAVIYMLIHEGSTVQQGYANVQMSTVRNYAHIVSDLLNYPDIFPSDRYAKIVKKYIYKKYQMFFYQARLNKQFDVAQQILKECIEFEFDLIYILKSKIHLMLRK